MQWEEIPEVMDDWVLKSAAPAWDVRQAAMRVLTSSHVGYYYHPGLEKVAIFAPLATAGDLSRTKAAAERAVGKSGVRSLFLTYQELADPDTGWVKVAYSPTIRRVGELLNFFPGQYSEGVPNTPSPVAAMLTSGLLGAGLGWGAGTLAGVVLPQGYGENLGRTGAILGGALGAAPGAVWGLSNKFHLGRRFNDNTLLNERVDAEPINYSRFIDGANAAPEWKPWPKAEERHSPLTEYIHDITEHAYMPHNLHGPPPSISRRVKHGIDLGLADIKLGRLYKQACEKVAYMYGSPGGNADAGTFGRMPVAYAPTPLDVNINALGQTLYNQGASPNLAATTMSSMYAAQQLPDPRASPGWVTGDQLAQLAENAVGDYTKGYLVGAAINTVIGTPFRASTFGTGNVALGVIGAVVPKLFGG